MLKPLGLLVLALTPFCANAYEDAALELQGFEAYSDILPGDSYLSGETKTSSYNPSRKKSIIPLISSSLPEAATYNIKNAEQVFCYQVTKRPAQYTGYTLSSFAIKGYCGELNASDTLTAYEALFTQSPNIITTQANCHIEPRVMLRFVRGVDYTDVLLSLPCPSFTVFYAGKYKAYNIKQGIITDLVEKFEKNTSEFNSPSLLKQTIANATASNIKEADILEKKQKETAPTMKWKQQDTTDEPKPQSEPKTGWGKIKLRK